MSINERKIKSMSENITVSKDKGVYKGLDRPKIKEGFFQKIFQNSAVKKLYKDRISLSDNAKYNLLENYLQKFSPNVNVMPHDLPMIFMSKNVDELGLMLAYNADPNAKTPEGKTCFQVEINNLNNKNIKQESTIEKMLLLVKNGANVENQDAKEIFKMSLENSDLKILSQSIAESNPKLMNDYLSIKQEEEKRIENEIDSSKIEEDINVKEEQTIESTFDTSLNKQNGMEISNLKEKIQEKHPDYSIPSLAEYSKKAMTTGDDMVKQQECYLKYLKLEEKRLDNSENNVSNDVQTDRNISVNNEAGRTL